MNMTGKTFAGKLPWTVVALGMVSFFTDLSSEMIYPLLPVFLVSVLEAGALSLGIVEGVAESTASLLKVFSGWWSDKDRRRKPLIMAGYGISGFTRPLIGLAAAWPFVLVLRFADRVGKGLRTSPRDALIADVTDTSNRGRAYGLHRAMDHAGAVAGPLAAAGLMTFAGLSMRQVFLMAMVPAAVVMIVLIRGVSEPATYDPGPSLPVPLAGWRGLGAGYRRFLLAILVFTLGNSTDAFLLLRLVDAGIGASSVAVLWSIHHMVKMLGVYFGGKQADRTSCRAMITAGWALYAGIYLVFALADSKASLVVCFITYGLYFGFTEPAERSWVANLVPSEFRGTAFGYFHGAAGLAALPASLIFGLVWQALGPAFAFTLGALLAAAAAVLISRVPESAV